MKVIQRMLTCSLMVVLTTSGLQAQGVTLKKNQVYKAAAGITCGYFEGKKKWLPVKKVKGLYQLKKGAPALQKNTCKALLKPNRSISLTQFPDASAILSAAAQSGSIGSSTVSGTPPTFSEIVASGGTNVFWREGVIDAVASGSPTQDQCNEFLSGSNDGDSGGFGACYLTEGVGYSLSNIASSGTSLCYMRNFPQKAAENSGIVDVIAGTFPNGGVSKIFSVPAGAAPRLIKVKVVGAGSQAEDENEGPSNIIFRIYSAEQNASQGNQYRYDLLFCDDGATGSPTEFEQAKITSGGEYVASTIGLKNNFKSSSTVRGFLNRVNGTLVFDPSRGRTAVYGGISSEEDREANFKSLVTLNGENEIRFKVREQRGESSLRRGYSVSRFSGDSLANLRFLEGAFEESQENAFSFEGATEYRDTYYAASPAGNYASELASVDLDADDFYEQGIATPTVPTSASCDVDVDLEITLDMSSEAMQEVAAECETARVDGDVSFCQTEQLQTAQQRWQSVCSMPPQ